jgi:hypothetical protein
MSVQRLSFFRALVLAGLLVIAIGAGVVALVTLGGDSSEPGEDTTVGVPNTNSTASEPIHQPAGVVHGGGGAPPEYLEAVPLVPGDYKPPSASTETHIKFTEALAAEGRSPKFSGVVNGFRVYGWADAEGEPSLLQKECVSVQFREVSVFEFTYLPAGTKARSPQYAGVCADGSTAWVTQDFVYGYGTFSVGYELGEKAIGHEAAAERVTSASIAGQPGVIIRPLIDEGNGQSIVAFRLDKGFIVVGAVNLPLLETLTIAEGIRCAGC